MKEKAIADAWISILPTGVSISCGEMELNFPSLSLSEQISIGKVSSLRLQEFAFGRMHARMALEQMGIFNSEIPKNMQTGAPIWPETVIGSIAHSLNGTNSHVAAIIAKSSQFHYLGIDAEWVYNLHPGMWNQFLSAQEVCMVQNVTVTERNAYVFKLWALKEAAIKAFGSGDMLTWSVFKSADDEVFELVNPMQNKSMTLQGKAVILQGLVLAVVYSYANGSIFE